MRNGHLPESQRGWAELLKLSQLSALSIAHMMLSVVDDPALVTPEVREDLVEMITELEYAVAHFEEYIL